MSMYKLFYTEIESRINGMMNVLLDLYNKLIEKGIDSKDIGNAYDSIKHYIKLFDVSSMYSNYFNNISEYQLIKEIRDTTKNIIADLFRNYGHTLKRISYNDINAGERTRLDLVVTLIRNLRSIIKEVIPKLVYYRIYYYIKGVVDRDVKNTVNDIERVLLRKTTLTNLIENDIKWHIDFYKSNGFNTLVSLFNDELIPLFKRALKKDKSVYGELEYYKSSKLVQDLVNKTMLQG